MNYRQTIEYLYGLQMFGARPGLEVPRQLATLAGNPEENLRFIHVAGTNGKGSTGAMLESIFRAAGLRVGLFTSPHLVSFAERIQVNRELIPETEVVRVVTELEPLLRRFSRDVHPTFFEVVTVMALRYFAGQRCDLVIWEAGLGGRLDATNIVTPLASVITTIDFDHQQWLGDSLDQIAAEKAGIIKPGVPVITAAEPGRGLEVITETARRLQAPLTVVTRAETETGIVATVALPLRGRHQRLNAAIAAATVKALPPKMRVSDSAIRDGLSRVSWPGRLQVVKTGAAQTLVLDGAHNAAGAAALREALATEFPGQPPVLILGVLADKDWEAMAETLAPLASRILLVPVNSQRTLAPKQLMDTCHAANPSAPVQTCVSLELALTAAASEEFVLVTGSLYLVGQALELLQLSAAPTQDERRLNEWGGTPSVTP